MLLVIVDVCDSRLKMFPTLLVPELAHMPPSLTRLSAISSLDNVRAPLVRSESALSRNEHRVLVRQKLANERRA